MAGVIVLNRCMRGRRGCSRKRGKRRVAEGCCFFFYCSMCFDVEEGGLYGVDEEAWDSVVPRVR